ncbi:hypothetical protein CARUB_v10016525mg, partial [Capsella rubella]
LNRFGKGKLGYSLRVEDYSIETCIWHATSVNDENLRLITTFCSPQGSGERGARWDPNGVSDSDLQKNAWLHLYAQVATYSKWDIYMVDHLPLELKKVVVQTKEDDIE